MKGPMGSRTELAPPFGEPVRGRQEGHTAVSASGFYSALPCASAGHEQFVIADYRPSARPLSEQVAGDTSWNEVGRIVVHPVAVQVIGDDGIPSSAALDPLQSPIAPVASLWPYTYLEHQYQPMLLDSPVAGSEWVIGPIQMAVSSHRNSITAEGCA